MLTPQVTVTGLLKDLFGANVAGGSLVVQLCNFGATAPCVAGTAMIARTAPLAVASLGDGSFEFQVWGNDVITPYGTFYTIQIIDDGGNVVQVAAYQFTGTVTIDLSSAVPYLPVVVLPVQPTIIGGLVVVPYSATPIFNCALIAGPITFQITLNGNVTSSTITNVSPGQIVTFILIQPAAGNKTFAWPSGVNNATTMDTDLNSTTAQSFIVRADGQLYPLSGGTYN